MTTITKEIAELLFALECAYPYVLATVGNKTCSSAGGPAALKAIFVKYDWANQRRFWIGADAQPDRNSYQ